MSYEQYRPNKFSYLPLVVKNLLIINGLFFLATLVLKEQFGIDLEERLGLHYPSSPAFRPYQIITYMFMHGGFLHIFLNLYALWMFGISMENFWGPKRFLTYYMITGIGAGLIQLLVTYLRLMPLYDQVTPDQLELIRTKGYEILQSRRNFADPIASQVNALIIPIPIPIKAKWIVIGLGIEELGRGIINDPDDNTAHFAHLGGMLFGFIMIKYWQKKSKHFY